MSTFIEKSCVGVTAPAFLRDKKSKTIELLKLRQCRDSCCPKIFTESWVEEMVDRGFATTSEDKTSTSKAAGVGAFPIRTDISGVAATEFTVELETAGGPIVPTSDPAKNLGFFLYEINGGPTLIGARIYLSDSPGQPQRLKDTQTISGLISGDIVSYTTTIALTSDSTGTGYTTVLETGTFTLP